jgi:hypothetical protein
VIERLAIQANDQIWKTLDHDKQDWNQYLGVTQ